MLHFTEFQLDLALAIYLSLAHAHHASMLHFTEFQLDLALAIYLHYIIVITLLTVPVLIVHFLYLKKF